jgi:tetratricopeptide (TPR) repeat protein
MQLRPSRIFLLSMAIAGVLAAPLVLAQDDNVPAVDKHDLVSKRPTKVVQLFPGATRAEPESNSSSPAMVKNINQMHVLVDAKQNDAALALGATMLADPKANHFDKSAAYQGIGYANFGKHDYAKAAEALQSSITENGLPNNDHYQMMFNLAQAQIASNQADAGLATVNRLATETKLDKPEYDSVRGRAYFMKKDYANAAQVLQKSLDATAAKPDPNEQQMLFAAYYELKQSDKAVKLGEGIMRAHPDDKASMMNLAAAYQQAGQTDKTLALLSDARKRGLLATSDDYRKLIQLYTHVKGGEGETIAIINEGMQKGILQPSAEIYSVMAQDYYATNQVAQAIEAYKKADGVSTDGEAALNLAKVYNNEGRKAEAKAAAQRALSKGVSDQQGARKIVAAGGDGKAPGKKK